mmetsp:Transcript_1879/g.4156  ORF Transcript_1879/g.4156 Transcript_1879/m.4156 type:complete len:214 (+) Transcript_1879:3246-3887(+)
MLATRTGSQSLPPTSILSGILPLSTAEREFLWQKLKYRAYLSVSAFCFTCFSSSTFRCRRILLIKLWLRAPHESLPVTSSIFIPLSRIPNSVFSFINEFSSFTSFAITTGMTTRLSISTSSRKCRKHLLSLAYASLNKKRTTTASRSFPSAHGSSSPSPPHVTRSFPSNDPIASAISSLLLVPAGPSANFGCHVTTTAAGRCHVCSCDFRLSS